MKIASLTLSFVGLISSLSGLISFRPFNSPAMTLMLEYVIFRNQERQWNFKRKLFVLIVEGDAIWVARNLNLGGKQRWSFSTDAMTALIGGIL